MVSSILRVINANSVAELSGVYLGERLPHTVFRNGEPVPECDVEVRMGGNQKSMDMDPYTPIQHPKFTTRRTNPWAK